MRRSRAGAVLLAIGLAALAAVPTAFGKGAPAAPKVPPAGQIAGTVHDVGGYVVADAQVTVSWEGAKAPVTTTSDAKGLFLARGIATGVDATILVKGKATIPDERVVPMPKDKGVLVDVTLRGGILFAGKVVDTRGKPIAGARIDSVSKTQWGKMGRVTIRRGGQPEDKPLASVLDGSFAVDKLLVGGTYVLSFVHPHFAPLAMPEMKVEPGRVRDDLVATMEDGAWIVGTVVDAADKPVAKAKVHLDTKDLKTWKTPASSEELDWLKDTLDRADEDPSHTTNERGRFTVGSLVGPEATITVSAEGFYDGTAKVEGLVAGQEKADVKIALEPANATISGRVVSTTGKPVAGARVLAHGDGGETQEAKSDAGGIFQVQHVKSKGAVSLSVRHDGFVAVSVDNVAPGATDVVVTMQRAAKLHVKVVDEDGEPFERLIVRTWLGTESPKDSSSNEWDFVEQGEKGIDVELPIGEVRVKFTVSGYESKTLGPYTTTVGQKIDGDVVKLARKAR